MTQPASIWRCGCFELALVRPLVMGILNVTPDSFSDAGEHFGEGEGEQWARALIAQGADIIDVGGESTRPGSDPVPLEAEIDRVTPAIAALAGCEIPVSVDTRHAEVAQAAVAAGATIINDVSGFRDPKMVRVAAESDAGVVVMHMLGEPKTMQQAPQYEDVVAEVVDYLLAQASMLEESGIERERIAIDPGIGFGKTLDHNLALLRATPRLVATGYPVLIGASRKRFIGEITGVAAASERVAGSVAAAVESARLGARILRVHDVAQTVQALAVSSAIATNDFPQGEYSS